MPTYAGVLLPIATNATYAAVETKAESDVEVVDGVCPTAVTSQIMLVFPFWQPMLNSSSCTNLFLPPWMLQKITRLKRIKSRGWSRQCSTWSSMAPSYDRSSQ
ncbi:hypothetical protein GOP47_0006858 [Adiantum capillus-veneris]|uniref:Uncharacterized protein n=1 Tax=Adiantum capillus-veneris TaxID=13818 RepID=A0A9D4V4E6_ADICA|nr:hypothetical protein GOP47_0006858 [Adiantum capillus-veneris]